MEIGDKIYCLRNNVIIDIEKGDIYTIENIKIVKSKYVGNLYTLYLRSDKSKWKLIEVFIPSELHFRSLFCDTKDINRLRELGLLNSVRIKKLKEINEK